MSQAKCARLEADFHGQHTALKQETRAALSKALHELSKTQKVGTSSCVVDDGLPRILTSHAIERQKRDAYKRKCVEIHEQFKRLMKDASSFESKMLQMKQQHAGELQMLLSQLSDAESEKTFLMQRQVEMGFAPVSGMAKVGTVEPTLIVHLRCAIIMLTPVLCASRRCVGRRNQFRARTMLARPSDEDKTEHARVRKQYQKQLWFSCVSLIWREFTAEPRGAPDPFRKDYYTVIKTAQGPTQSYTQESSPLLPRPAFDELGGGTKRSEREGMAPRHAPERRPPIAIANASGPDSRASVRGAGSSSGS